MKQMMSVLVAVTLMAASLAGCGTLLGNGNGGPIVSGDGLPQWALNVRADAVAIGLDIRTGSQWPVLMSDFNRLLKDIDAAKEEPAAKEIVAAAKTLGDDFKNGAGILTILGDLSNLMAKIDALKAKK